MQADAPVGAASGTPAAEAEAVTRYFTFGSAHARTLLGTKFDERTVVRITAPDPRAEMVALFGSRWAFEYDEPPTQYWDRMVDLSPGDPS